MSDFCNKRSLRRRSDNAFNNTSINKTVINGARTLYNNKNDPPLKIADLLGPRKFKEISDLKMPSKLLQITPGINGDYNNASSNGEQHLMNGTVNGILKNGKKKQHNSKTITSPNNDYISRRKQFNVFSLNSSPPLTNGNSELILSPVLFINTPSPENKKRTFEHSTPNDENKPNDVRKLRSNFFNRKVENAELNSITNKNLLLLLREKDTFMETNRISSFPATKPNGQHNRTFHGVTENGENDLSRDRKNVSDSILFKCNNSLKLKTKNNNHITSLNDDSGKPLKLVDRRHNSCEIVPITNDEVKTEIDNDNIINGVSSKGFEEKVNNNNGIGDSKFKPEKVKKFNGNYTISDTIHLNGSGSIKIEELTREIKEELINGDLTESETEGNSSENENVSNNCDEDFKVGDLAWARIGRHPHWPCIIVTEPNTGLFKKQVVGKKRVLLYHVRFFGDNGRRAWVKNRSIVLYENKNEINRLAIQYKYEKKLIWLNSTPLKIQQINWQMAIKEIKLLKRYSISNRIKRLGDIIVENKLSSPSTSRRSTETRKRSLPSPEKSITERKKRKLPEIVVKEEVIEIVEKEKTNDSIILPTFESLTSLYKRNHLLRGIPRAKVCQVCYKPGKIVKCKGRCNGLYHVECGSKVMTEINLNIKTEEEEDTIDESILLENMSLAEKIDYKMKQIMDGLGPTIYPETIDDDDDDTDDSGRIKEEETEQQENSRAFHVTAENSNFDECVIKKEEIEEVIYKCGFCSTSSDPYCFVCHKFVTKQNCFVKLKCSVGACGKFYHTDCLKLWPQTQWSFSQHITKTKVESMSFACPAHVCHTCVSDDPRQSTSRLSGDKVVRCLKCPAAYHSTAFCIPAGSQFLSYTQIICPRHYGETNNNNSRKFQQTINTTWCFLCGEGGKLICCETCPTSVHTDCLPINLTDDDKFICEDCESGRFPLYDEIVWTKLGNFRWWPGIILFPNEIPDSVSSIRHNKGEFVVKFFGTYNHSWVGRCRTFLFQDGDKGYTTIARTKMDENFRKAVDEATESHQIRKEFKLNQIEQIKIKTSQKPPPYIRIKMNRPVGKVKLFDSDNSNTTACDCSLTAEHPCGPDSNCLNRLLLTECNAEVCPAGVRCENQRFEKRQYVPLVAYKTESRGWGLKSLEPIQQGQFVIEYVGEIIDEAEYRRRIKIMHQKKEENYYFLTIDNMRMIDAGPKGNLARFMNHSCEPNCQTQKWTVNGNTRVGLFATVDIPANTELTFNYNLECIGKEKKICKCGAQKCSGFIGVKVKTKTEEGTSKKKSKTKKKRKKKLKQEPILAAEINKFCFVCNRGNNLVTCISKICNKNYHLRCINMTDCNKKKFLCPSHYCNVCSKQTFHSCFECNNSFCREHFEGNLRYQGRGYLCKKHDNLRRPNQERKVKNKVPPKKSEKASSLNDSSKKEKNQSEIEKKSKKRKRISQENENNIVNNVKRKKC